MSLVTEDCSSQDDLIIDEEAGDIQSGGHPHTPDDSSDSELKMEMFPLEDINYNWLDIGDEFNKCCEYLVLGELLHDVTFGLYEAMSAIEMMDPKMDAGLLCNRGDHRVLNFVQSLEAGILKLENFEDEQLIGIIDTTMSCFVSWLEGHSLAQTVFTNLYMHEPGELKDRTLKMFCITMYKILEIVRDFIHSAGVFEEEDFQPAMYGYGVAYVSEPRMNGMLKEIELELYKRTKLRNANVEKSKYYANPDSALALYARFKLIRLLYSLLTLLGQMGRSKRKKTTPDCIKVLTQLNEILPIIINSIQMGTQYTSMGFEPLVNQRLLPPTFPRYTKIKSSRLAYKYLEDLMERFRFIIKIEYQRAFHSAVDFFIEFSRSRPCVLSRSILQVLYFGNCRNGICGSPNSFVLTSLLFVEVLRDACKNFIAPPSLTTFNKQMIFSSTHMERQFLQGRDYVNSFFLHCIRPFTNLIQLYGHNHARQRDKLAHLLDELATLQDEAERVDAFLHQQYTTYNFGRPHVACFGTWVLYHTLQVMIMYLLAGFELELYSTHEYYYIYWYLYEFLYGWLISALNRAENFISWTDADASATSASTAASSKSKAKKAKQPKKKKNASRHYEREILYYQALQNICGGYFKGLFGLRYDNIMKLPCNEFSLEPTRFEHRFAPFRSLVTPPPAFYKEFSDSTHVLYTIGDMDTKNLYRCAAEHFLQARLALENISSTEKEIAGLTKVVKWNFVVFKILAGGHQTDLESPLEFDFSDHSLFPLIKVQVSKNQNKSSA